MLALTALESAMMVSRTHLKRGQRVRPSPLICEDAMAGLNLRGRTKRPISVLRAVDRRGHMLRRPGR